MILMILERILFSFSDGFRNSFIPQYKDSGNAIMPAQVIKVPRGIELASSNAVIINEEPVTKNIIMEKVTIKELKNQIFLLFILQYTPTYLYMQVIEISENNGLWFVYT